LKIDPVCKREEKARIGMNKENCEKLELEILGK